MLSPYLPSKAYCLSLGRTQHAGRGGGRGVVEEPALASCPPPHHTRQASLGRG